MNLAAFYAEVRKHVNRGSELDDVLPFAVRNAVVVFERANSMPYMERFMTYILPEGKRAVVMPCRAKSVYFNRYVLDSGQLVPIDKVEPHVVESRGVGYPRRYWFDNEQYIWFDKEAHEDIPFELGVDAFSEWPDVGSASEATHTHWLLDNALDYMMAQTMFNLAPHAREPDWFNLYSSMKGDAIQTLLTSISEHDLRDSRAKMKYRPEWYGGSKLEAP